MIYTIHKEVEMFAWITKIINNVKREIAYKKRIKELKKRDPFIYK